MDYTEKINIYVPHEIEAQLSRDATFFEIFKKDSRKVNMNGFLSKLLCGYYENYVEEKKAVFAQISAILKKSTLAEFEISYLASNIRDLTFFPEIPERKGKGSKPISLKPTEKTRQILMDMDKEMEGDEHISHYLCQMLVSYCRKPFSVREQILFKSEYEFLQRACKAGFAVSFTYIWDKNTRHEVMPFALATGAEEMFNYLICDEKDPRTGLSEVRSYRLNRIMNPNVGKRTTPISPTIRKRCERTVSIAPQYAINSGEHICVKLDDSGERLYNRIYYGRPDYAKIEDRADGHYYYFDCSPVQVFHYFRRFDNGTAVIISPPSLREKMIAFHEDALSAYEHIDDPIEATTK